MTITKEISKEEKSSVKLQVTIGKEDVRSEYDGLLSDYTKNAQIKGFRKGKVPANVLERKFGEALKGEVMGKIIEKALEEIFQDENLPRESRPLPYARPELRDEPKLDLEKDLEFSVYYDVLPTVKLGPWEGLKVTAPEIERGTDDLNKELEAIRERNSIVLDKSDDEKAENNDVVTVSFSELDEAGEVIESSKREDFTFTLGTKMNYFQFDDEMLGMKKGETREFTKTYGTDMNGHELEGTTKKLRVSLSALKLKKLPDLDDDLAQDVDEKYKTLDDLKKSIQDRLDKAYEAQERSAKINSIIESIMESTPVEIPESMMLMELDSRWRNMAGRLNTDSNGLLRMLGNSTDQAKEMLDSFRPDAQKSLHARLIIETIIEELKLQASDEEADAEMARLAAETGVALEEVKKYYVDGGHSDYLKEEIKEKKAFDILLEKNSVSFDKAK